MRWSRDNSIVLSKVFIWIFAAFEILCAVILPTMVGGIARRRGMDVAIGKQYFMTSFYALMVPASAGLWYLYRLLLNIGREEVFVESNVRCLRRISWVCYLAALISLLSTFYYLPFGVLAAAAGFMGLVLRVVKNVFAEAVNLKQENDFTI